MRNFTIDRSDTRTNKTKRWLGLLTFCMMLLIGQLSFAQCPDGQTQINITTSGGNYTTEKWVNITTEPNGAGTVVWFQGNGTYGNGAGLINVNICLAPGTYYVNCYDQYADGWDGTLINISAYGVTLNNNGGASPNGNGDNDSGSSWESIDGNPNPVELEASLLINVPEPPSCFPPTGLSAISYLTSADVSWNTVDDEQNYEYAVT